MEIIQEISNYLTNISVDTWHTLGAYLAGSTLVATLVQIIKHKLKITDAKKLVTSLLGLFSFLTAFADFLIQQQATNPLPALGGTTATLIGGAVFAHRFLVSPVYYKVAAKLTGFAAFLDEVSQLQAAKKATPVAVPSQVDVVSPENLHQFQV